MLHIFVISHIAYSHVTLLTLCNNPDNPCSRDIHSYNNPRAMLACDRCGLPTLCPSCHAHLSTHPTATASQDSDPSLPPEAKTHGIGESKHNQDNNHHVKLIREKASVVDQKTHVNVNNKNKNTDIVHPPLPSDPKPVIAGRSSRVVREKGTAKTTHDTKSDPSVTDDVVRSAQERHQEENHSPVKGCTCYGQ